MWIIVLWRLVDPIRLLGKGFDRLELRKVLDKYAEVLNSLPGLTNLSTVKIETGEHPPISQQPYHPPERLLSRIKEELDILLETNIITPSTSAWSSPMIPVRKPNGKVRVCIDFRKLNAITVKHQFYMPTLEEIIDKIGQKEVISKLDLSKGFYLVPMDPADSLKTTFVCPFCKFKLERIPFGLCNVPAVFQEVGLV